MYQTTIFRVSKPCALVEVRRNLTKTPTWNYHVEASTIHSHPCEYLEKNPVRRLLPTQRSTVTKHVFITEPFFKFDSCPNIQELFLFLWGPKFNYLLTKALCFALS
jgi:hypothetical protein